jgi:hypothetical protein
MTGLAFTTLHYSKLGKFSNQYNYQENPAQAFLLAFYVDATSNLWGIPHEAITDTLFDVCLILDTIITIYPFSLKEVETYGVR